MEKQKTQDNMEAKIEKKVEKTITENLHVVGNIILIIISLGMIYVVHNVTSWDHSFFDFVKDDFNKIIWVIDLSLITGIIASGIKIFSNNKVYHKIGQVIDNIFSLVSIVVSLVVFPFDFKELINISWINTGAKAFWIFIVFAILAATITEVVKLVTNNIDEKEC